VVAQYAALPTRMRVAGRELCGLQVVDSMVHPEHRSGARQPGLFVLTARAFFAAHGGAERDPLHYGWPVERAWRVGHRLLDYEVVRVQNALVAELAALAPATAAAPLPAEVRAVERFGAGFDALGRRCADDVGATALRGADYLNWRFADHPRHAYRALAVGGEGLAVWRAADQGLAGLAAPGLAVLVEWLVPLGRRDVAAALLQAVASEARAAGLSNLALWCPEWSPWCEEFQSRGFLVQPSDYLTAARSWLRGQDLPWLRDHWWYQLSDTDLA
jgi:hypothetical protein